MFKVFTTKEFDDDFNNLDESDKKRVRKIFNNLKAKGQFLQATSKAFFYREKI